MPGPPPKDPSALQRRNKHVTHAVLRRPDVGEIEVPKLPNKSTGSWHPMTLRWWVDVWSSPMAPEYDESDLHGLFLLAQLTNDFWFARDAKERQLASAEIRLQSVRFGLSPIDRRRLQWEIEKVGDAQDRGRRRRARQQNDEQQTDDTPVSQLGADPRGILRSV